jgi:hypothetical protein
MASENSEKRMQEVAYSQPNVPDNWHMQVGDDNSSMTGTPAAQTHQPRPEQDNHETQSQSTSTSETEER